MLKRKGAKNGKSILQDVRVSNIKCKFKPELTLFFALWGAVQVLIIPVLFQRISY